MTRHKGANNNGIISYHDEKKCLEKVRFHNNQKTCVLVVGW